MNARLRAIGDALLGNERRLRIRSARCLLACGLMAYSVASLGYFVAARLLPFGVFFFMYLLPFFLGSVLASTTSMIEHYEMEESDDAYSSRTYASKMPIANFIWNNLGYHNEHHNFPGIPHYNLKKFHEAALPYYDERIKSNIFPNFFGLVFHLWGRILKVDVDKIDAKYAHLNRNEETQKHMKLQGINPANAT